MKNDGWKMKIKMNKKEDNGSLISFFLYQQYWGKSFSLIMKNTGEKKDTKWKRSEKIELIKTNSVFSGLFVDDIKRQQKCLTENAIQYKRTSEFIWTGNWIVSNHYWILRAKGIISLSLSFSSFSNALG